ncbi:MAG: hypothetical protein HY951_14705 [Bacteroidia bacterium]|nr:hypothetical protein [Bacteroidia bacterium]
MNSILKKVAIVALVIVFPFIVNAQCKGFTKKECMPALKPYVYNGQLNSAVLNEGDVAELLLTFYSGQDYRIYVCAQEMLGNLEFKLLDTDRNTLFYNKDHDFVKFWDFKSNSTQQLIVQVRVPQAEVKSEIIQSGCVSILVGFKE